MLMNAYECGEVGCYNKNVSNYIWMIIILIVLFQILAENENNDIGPAIDYVQFYTGETSKYIFLTVYADQVIYM